MLQSSPLPPDRPEHLLARGFFLRKADVDTALVQAEEIVRDVRERLSRKAAFGHLAERLEVEFGPQPAWEGEPVKMAFPWD